MNHAHKHMIILTLPLTAGDNDKNKKEVVCEPDSGSEL